MEHPPRLRAGPPGLGHAGYHTTKLTAWAAALKMTLQIVAKRDPHAFEVLPRRLVVERTFAWISKHRRTVRDYEHLPASHEAMILWAMVALMTRRLAEVPGLRRSSASGPGVSWCVSTAFA